MAKIRIRFTQENILKVIVKQRKLLGISQTELAHKTGLGWATIQRLEKNDREARLSTINRVCKVLNIQLVAELELKETEDFLKKFDEDDILEAFE